MSNLIALAFQEAYRAEEVLGLLRQLEQEGLGRIDEAVVVVCEQDGRIRPLEGLDVTVPRLAQTAGGAGLGLLIAALLAGPVLLGAMAGGLIARALGTRSQTARAIQQFGRALEPGNSALFCSGQASNLDALLARLAPQLADATILTTALPPELLEQITTQAQAAAPPLARPPLARLLVIINPAAGVARPILKPLNQVLHPAGIRWDVAITHEASDARRYASTADAAGYDAVAVYGGDGSVMEAASGLMGRSLPLVILPGGTGNVMASELGIPSEVGAAAQLIVESSAQLRSIDLGQVGERCFALRVCTGYEADYVAGTSREAKERRGMLAYALSAIQQDLRKVPYRLTLDGQPVEVEGYSCMVANSGNFGLAGRSLHSQISISDGRLDVLVVTNLNFIAALRAQRPSHSAEQRMVRHWQVAEVTVDPLTPQTVVGDGETWDDTPFTARVIPAALRVLVP